MRVYRQWPGGPPEGWCRYLAGMGGLGERTGERRAAKRTTGEPLTAWEHWALHTWPDCHHQDQVTAPALSAATLTLNLSYPYPWPQSPHLELEGSSVPRMAALCSVSE